MNLENIVENEKNIHQKSSLAKLRNRITPYILTLGILAGAYFSCSKDNNPVSPENTVNSEPNSISGKVTGTDETVKVRAIQNLSLIAETTTNPDGSYKISNLPEGKYGLLFIKGYGYIYNDQINSNWYIVEGNIEINETITVTSDKNSGDYDIDLGPAPSWWIGGGTGEYPDYGAGKIFVWFNDDVPQNKIDSLITNYNCSINHKYEWGSYLLAISDNKTVFEMIRAFKSESIVKHSYPNIILSIHY